MFVEERLEKILELLQKKNRVTVTEAEDYLNVSADTIRRDFSRLSEAGKVLRTHGGIIHIEKGSFDPGMDEKEQKYREAKESIAKVAASRIRSEEAIILDAGSTTEKILKYLSKEVKNIKIITEALNIAFKSTEMEIETIIFGGVVRNETYSIIGPDAVKMIKNYHADKMILAVSAVSLEKGLMVPNRMEAEIKQELIKIANQIILVADHSKMNKTAFFSVAPVDTIDILITDSKTDPDFINQLKARGIKVIIS